MVLLACNAQARTVEIKMSQCPKPYVENISKMTSNLGTSDVLILNFDKAGKYEFDGSLKFRCNTTIKGVGSQTTKVIVKEGSVNGKSKMADNTFFAIHGSTNKKVRAEIKDISFELASHKDILWEKSPKHIIKVCDGNGVTVDNVTFWSTDAVLTHVDLRDCSNVVVENCTFENYNNCDDGGCLWSRGDQSNITVRNNIFKKYGKDEALAVWGGKPKVAHTSVKNIVVENNEFLYENKTKCKRSYHTHVLICFYHFKEYDFVNTCIVDSIVFKNNTITMNTPYARNIVFNYDNLANVKNIEISGNRIFNTSKASIKNDYSTDLTISLPNNNTANITINNNWVNSSSEVLRDGKNSGYTFFTFKNVSLNMLDNNIDSDYPVTLLWCQGGDNTVNLVGNTVSGLNRTATTSTGVNSLTINANGNHLIGDTRIYCSKLENLELNFTNNVFTSDNNNFFLEEGAPSTSVYFAGNTVQALTGKGKMFTNYSGKAYKFTKVQVINNTFNGLSKQSLEDSFKNVRNKSLNGNVYR